MAMLQIKLNDDTVINMSIPMLLFEYGIYAQEGTTVTTILSDGERSLQVVERMTAPPEGG